MSRDDGFRIADQDTGFMADSKVIALARRLRDPIRTGAAIALHDAVRLASWGAGRRVTLDEALPGWWLDPVDDMASHLVAVGLLDEEWRIPIRAWEGWFVPALDRVLQARRRNIYAGLVSRGMAPPEANTEADRRIAEHRLNLLGSTSEAKPLGPTSYRTAPSDRTDRAGDAREGRATNDDGSDPFADPESPVLAWLAQHGCDVRPGNGYTAIS